MKKTKFFYYLISIVLLIGCSEDDTYDEGIKPTADFSFTNDGSTFTFTNLSENATSYRWDFGDLYFYSDEENPIYTYTIGGELVVSLTVTNESGGEDYISKTIIAPEIIIIDIKIDGEFEDWENVEFAYDESDSGTGSMQKIKIWGGGENVNVYLEGNSTMKMELVDIFINSDGNPETGFLSWQWPNGSGADWLFEGPLLSNSWGAFYQHNDPAGGWAWNWLGGSENMISSGIVNVSSDVNAIEFSIPKSQLGTLGDSIGFAFTELTGGWALVASFPEVTATSSFVTIEL
ncbi:MAG: PKD domain-containing protein [Bacteroidota bacterium]